MSESILATEKEYLLANHEALAKQYPGQFVIVKGEAVHGAFPTHEQAVRKGVKMFGIGPFLVRSVDHPEDGPPIFIPGLSLGIPMTDTSLDIVSVAPAHKYEIVIRWSDTDQAFIAEAPELPGCFAHGDSHASALENVMQVIDLSVATANKFGDSVL